MGAASPLDLPAYRALVLAEVKDQGGKLVDPDDFDIALLDAVREYSTDVDRVVSVEVTGSGSRYTRLNFPGWQDGFSSVTDIDISAKPAPADPTTTLPSDVDPSFLEVSRDVDYRLIGSTNYLFTPNHQLGPSDRWRIYYTRMHSITGLDGATETSILPQHVRGIVALAASNACLKLSILYADMVELEQYNADIIDTKSKSDQYSQRSTTLRKNYNTIIGQVNDASPANVFGKFQSTFQWGRPFLTHKFRGSG
jgi:hypothetical protein